ncbi:MAG: Pb-reticulocyte-binding protein [Rivularia sp. (in: cyanobacteria)]|uniref:Pb-reticulocyte-binding protein n=1 Tax=Plectonema cf. radiosum LEGE 06105 TaxID=945769 RepID=A0A8J7F5B9_9CYAN|nr:Pb-reticulocyte-binding protein [Plectonema radiosum]MBE9214010.1 Pb-reticulocyte-binding protein [Plectonema cf. radiosum LEGE 06105]NJN13475.1 Pb-reticulocyte-binding protein [Richelia sp. RM1_1_1]
MIQAIGSEQIFVTNLEEFMSKADKFIKIYYSGISDENQVREMMQELKNLVLDTDLQQLEIDYQHSCEINDLMADYHDSSWW